MCIKRRGHTTPDTLPIDFKILDVTKNSASGCSHECTFTSIGESLHVQEGVSCGSDCNGCVVYDEGDRSERY